MRFKKYINELCRKASYELHALQRMRRYLSVDRARLVANLFIGSQFSYAPLIWMFVGKTVINKICKIHTTTTNNNNNNDNNNNKIQLSNTP